MTALDRIKRILTRWYGKKFTVYVGDNAFEVTPGQLMESITPLQLKDPKKEAR